MHREEPPAAGLQITHCYRAEAHALQVHDRVAHGRAHQADLPLAAFVNRDPE